MSLSDYRTTEDELPIVYLNYITKQQAVFTWYAPDKKKIPGKYIFIIQDEAGEIKSSKLLESLEEVDEIRNLCIKDGYRYYQLPKVVTTQKKKRSKY